jgi:hypothetical protein
VELRELLPRHQAAALLDQAAQSGPAEQVLLLGQVLARVAQAAGRAARELSPERSEWVVRGILVHRTVAERLHRGGRLVVKGLVVE